jgi:hypothetical protein
VASSSGSPTAITLAVVKRYPTDQYACVSTPPPLRRRNAQVSGTFWLSRLTRDGDAMIRTRALSLLARLVSPSAGPAHRMLEALWPDAPAAAVRTVLGGRSPLAAAGSGGSGGGVAGTGPAVTSSSECLAGRAAALRFLTCVLGRPEEDGRAQVRGRRTCCKDIA